MSETETTASPQATGPKKERSPNFPFITLTKAMDRVRPIFDAAKRHETRMGDLAEALGSGAKSSSTLQTVSALVSYGLLEDSGSGDARKFKVTDLAFKALEDQRPGAREAALREAAMKPKLLAEYAELWKEGRPSDAISTSVLRIDGGFTEDGAKTFLRVFDDAITYAAAAQNDKKSDASSNGAAKADTPKSDVKIAVGDLVQWEANGTLRLERPTAVRAIQEHEGAQWVFVEGSETGIPMSEVLLDQKAPDDAPRVPPTLAIPPVRRDNDRAPDGMDVDRFTVDEGVVRVEFPKGMGTASVEELDEFFQLFIKKAKRRAAAT
jgi:hypothetical protein